MEVFVRRLPESVTRLDLLHFLSAGAKGRWSLFNRRTSAAVINCEIFRIVNLEDDSVEFHGIAHVEPADVAMTTIERLDGSYLKGKLMEVRPYIQRSASGDRRRNPVSGETGYSERRRENRRREHLSIDTLLAGATRTDIGGPTILGRKVPSSARRQHPDR